MGTGDGDKQSDLPADPLLASAARGLLDAKHLGYIVDADWNVVFISDEMRIAFGLDPDLPTLYIGARYLAGVLASPLFGNSLDLAKASVSANAGMILADLGRDGVEAQADPRLLDVFDLVVTSRDVVPGAMGWVIHR